MRSLLCSLRSSSSPVEHLDFDSLCKLLLFLFAICIAALSVLHILLLAMSSSLAFGGGCAAKIEVKAE